MADSFDPTDRPVLGSIDDLTAFLTKGLGPLEGQAPTPVTPAAPQPPIQAAAAPQPVAPQPPAPPTTPVTPPAPPAPQPPAAARPQVDPASLADRYGNRPAAAPELPPSVDTLPESVPVDASGKPDPKANHAYAQLRSSVKRYEKEILPQLEKAKAEEAAARKAAEEKVAAILAEKDAVAKEKEALLEKVGQLSLTESPQFRQKYESREADVRVKLAKALTQTQRTDPAQAERVAGKLLELSSDPAALAEALQDFHPRAAAAVELMAQEWAAIDEEKRQELANWRQSTLSAGIQESREAVIQSAEERRRLADAGLGFAKRSGNPVFAESDDPAVSAQVAQLEQAFQGFMQTASQEQLAQAAAEGFVSPFLTQRIAEQDAELEALRREIQSFRGANRVPASAWAPSAPPPKPAAPAEGSRPAVDPDDPMNALNEFLQAGIPRAPRA